MELLFRAASTFGVHFTLFWTYCCQNQQQLHAATVSIRKANLHASKADGAIGHMIFPGKLLSQGSGPLHSIYGARICDSTS